MGTVNTSRSRYDRSEKAAAHVRHIMKAYSEEIGESIRGSKLYRDYDLDKGFVAPAKAQPSGVPKVTLLEADTVTALFSTESDKVCLLNFASNRHPGGGFITGATAQEEALCHESTLYPVLASEHAAPHYECNKNNYNSGLYSNAAIYSPDIVFMRDGREKKCDVLTCPSPNHSIKDAGVTGEENSEALRSRIEFIRDIAEENKPEVLILGAFGCGVFRQDPDEVSALFKEAFNKSDIAEIIYAVPAGKSKRNYEAFRKAFGK